MDGWINGSTITVNLASEDLGEVLLDFIRGIKNSIAIRLTGSQKAMLDEAERTLINLLRGETGSVEGRRLSVQQDEDGRTYVDIEEDILEGVPQEQWAKVVRNAIRRENIDLGDRVVQTTRAGAYEFTNSGYTRGLLKYEPATYADKMRMAGEIGDVVRTAEDYQAEGLNHPRRDNIAHFERGQTRFKIGEKMYEADVLLGVRQNGEAMLYDVVNLKESKSNSDAIYRLGEVQDPATTIVYAAADNSIAQGETGVKDSLAVPYRTPENKTLWEYMLEAYYGQKTAGKEGNEASARPAADTQGELPPTASPAEEWGRMAAQNYGRPAQQKTGSDGWVPGLPYSPAENGSAKTEGEAGQQAQAGPAGQTAPGDAKAEGCPTLKASAKSLEIQKRATHNFVDKVAGALSEPKWARREFLRPIAGRFSETFKTEGKIDQALADEMFEAAYEQGIIQDTEMVDQYGDLRREIRGTALRLDRQTLDSKSYNELRRRCFGILQLSKDGIPIDSYYMELCEAYPELFDSGITHPADQAERIYEVCKSIEVTSRDLDAYYGDDAEDFKRFARDGFDRALEGLGRMARGGYYTQGKDGEQLQAAVDQSDPTSWILARPDRPAPYAQAAVSRRGNCRLNFHRRIVSMSAKKRLSTS